MYGAAGGMYGSGGMYGGMGGMPGGGMLGGPGFDPNNPPAAPPSAWQAMLHAINGVMGFFGRLSFLVDENAHAVHFFISALLQLLDRAGSLYGEIARFVLRVIFRRRPALKAGADGKALVPAGAPGMVGRPGPGGMPGMPGMPGMGGMQGMGAAGLPASSHWEGLWKD